MQAVFGLSEGGQKPLDRENGEQFELRTAHFRP
jgi:hypothetical protein